MYDQPSAQQIIAEMGGDAETFDSAGEFSSWAGTCPGSEESAEQNHSLRSPKGNRFAGRILNQETQAAVKDERLPVPKRVPQAITEARIQLGHWGRFPPARAGGPEDSS